MLSIVIVERACLCAILFGIISVTFSDFPKCSEGEVLENECNSCICTYGYFECSKKVCHNVKAETMDVEICRPDIIYISNEMTCLCNENGHWSNKQCSDELKTLVNSKTNCIPDEYVIIGCNVCRCGSNGTADMNRCTKNNCSKAVTNLEFRKAYTQNQMYGKCKVNTWYSLAPCQFCYCVSENKLICNTGNKYPEKVNIGTYKLNECGENFINEALDLIPKNNLKITVEKSHSRDKGNHLKNDAVFNREKNLNSSDEDHSERNSNDRNGKKFRSKPHTSEIDVMKSFQGKSSGLLPIVMNKVFHTALKKAMVAVKSATKCVPQTSILVECNVCICIEEHTFMCTDNKCD